jgi:hypothetical protein
VKVYLDAGAGMAEDGWDAAWTFDLEHWGKCGQGPDRDAAVEDLARRCGVAVDRLELEEVVTRPRSGDETVFARDLVPASDAERAATLGILARARSRTVALVSGASDAALDRRDPKRRLPAYASWYTPRELAWHVADTESRYYLPVLGLPSRPRATDLLTELEESAAHVRRVVGAMAPDLRTDDPDHGAWSSTKVLRRLAWHERGELAVLERLLAG